MGSFLGGIYSYVSCSYVVGMMTVLLSFANVQLQTMV